MKMGWTTKWLCLACVGLPIVLTTAGMGQRALGASQTGSASILDRVQRENDPELSELIRIALMNRKDVSEQERFEIIRKVTQSYAQIKLLDQQVEQIARKAETATGPAEMRSELLLAKADLEAKRATELANLRELMGVIPRFPFESQPIPSLNAWVSLLPIDDRVLVLDALKPFSDYWALARHKVAGLLSERENLDSLRGRLRDKNTLPLRVDIYYKPETNNACLKLRDAIFSLAREANAEMRTEVRLEEINFGGSGESPFYLRGGKIRTLYAAAMRRPDGGPKLLVSGLVDPNDLEQSILWRLTTPKVVPLRFRIEHDEDSTRLARQVARTAESLAKRLGIAELVEVAAVLVDPVPETAFLGRWEALGKGYLQTIDVQTQGVCQVLMGEGSQAIKAGTTVKGTWLPTTKEILVDINDKVWAKPHYYYLGSLNENGNLVVERAEIYLQGSIQFSGVGRTIFKKVS